MFFLSEKPCQIEIDSRSENDCGTEYYAVLYHGESEECLHIDDEIWHKDLTGNSVYQYQTKGQVKRRIFFYHVWLKAVKDIPKITALFKRRTVLQLDDAEHTAYGNDNSKTEEHFCISDHLHDDSKSTRNNEHRHKGQNGEDSFHLAAE